MKCIMNFLFVVSLAIVSRISAVDEWEAFAQRAVSIDRENEIPLNIFDIERELDGESQPTRQPTRKTNGPTPGPTTRQPTHKATSADVLTAAKKIKVIAKIALTMKTLSCGDFNTQAWQHIFKNFLKVKLQLWKSSYIKKITSSVSDCSYSGNDDQWDDKEPNPSKAPTKAPSVRRQRRLADNVLTVPIEATGTSADVISKAVSSISAVNLPGYPPSVASASITITTDSPTSSPVNSPTAALCFSGSEQVTLENGVSKVISDVAVGDKILALNAAGEFVYSDVVFVPHAKNQIEAEFYQITTESGRDIKMTGLHMIPAGSCSATGALPIVYANTVAPGSCINTVNGREAVMEVKKTVESGIYTVVAMDEMIVVNGVVASPFGVSHTFTNIYYNLHRFAYRSFPKNMKSLIDANEFVGKMIFSMFSA